MVQLLTSGRSLESSLAPSYVRGVFILISLNFTCLVQNYARIGFRASERENVQCSSVKILIMSVIFQVLTRSFTYIISVVISSKHSSETSIIQRCDFFSSCSEFFIFCMFYDCFSSLLLCQGCNFVQRQMCY